MTHQKDHKNRLPENHSVHVCSSQIPTLLGFCLSLILVGVRDDEGRRCPSISSHKLGVLQIGVGQLGVQANQRFSAAKCLFNAFPVPSRTDGSQKQAVERPAKWQFKKGGCTIASEGGNKMIGWGQSPVRLELPPLHVGWICSCERMTIHSWESLHLHQTQNDNQRKPYRKRRPILFSHTTSPVQGSTNRKQPL